MNLEEEQKKKFIQHFRELEVYKKAFAAAMEIFDLTNNDELFLTEEFLISNKL
jgi:hypothetical protein